MLRSIALVAALAAALLAPAAARAQGVSPCSGSPDVVLSADILVGGQASHAEYVLPGGPPRGLVVMAHGYTHTAQSWREHMVKIAKAAGVVAVTPDYRGIRYEGSGPEGRARSRGWPVVSGADDLIAYAKHFLANCPAIRRVTLYGVSMGANVSGYALTLKPRKADGSPLFDYWFAVEGIHNFAQAYTSARLVEESSDFARQAREDLEAEAGGRIEDRAEEYTRRTNIERAEDIAASGIRGVLVYHGRFDGFAPYDQAQRLVLALQGRGVPVDTFEVGRRGSAEADIRAPGAPPEMAGHASDISQTHIVIQGGLDRLAALLARGEPAPCNRLLRVDGRFTDVKPNPTARSAFCQPDPLPAAGAACGAVTPVPHRIAAYAERTLRGHAGARGCGRIRDVRVAVLRRAGKRCRFLRARGRRLTPRRSCKRPVYRRARGREQWSLALPDLRRGTYRAFVVVRASDGTRTLASAPGPRFKVRARR